MRENIMRFFAFSAGIGILVLACGNTGMWKR
jgi:hypothetical protein